MVVRATILKFKEHMSIFFPILNKVVKKYKIFDVLCIMKCSKNI